MESKSGIGPFGDYEAMEIIPEAPSRPQFRSSLPAGIGEILALRRAAALLSFIL
jgi:hypothetical protein